MQKARFISLAWKDPLEKEMATHSSIAAWRIPCTKEPGKPVHGVTRSRTWLALPFFFNIIWPCGLASQICIGCVYGSFISRPMQLEMSPFILNSNYLNVAPADHCRWMNKYGQSYLNGYRLPFLKNHLTSPSCDLKTGELVSWKRYQRKVTLKTCWQKTLSRTLLSVQELMTKNSYLDAYFSTKMITKPMRTGIIPIKHPKVLFFTEVCEEIRIWIQDIWKMQTNHRESYIRSMENYSTCHTFICNASKK